MPNPYALEIEESPHANHKDEPRGHHAHLPVHVLKIEVANNMTNLYLPLATQACEIYASMGNWPGDHMEVSSNMKVYGDSC